MLYLIPTTAFSRCDLRMTGLAQRHEIVLGARTALRKWFDVVNFLGGRYLFILCASLTQRVSLDVTVADTLPRPAVTFLCGGISLVSFVLLCFLFGVLITEPSVRKFGTTGTGTRPLRFLWHGFNLVSTKRKALAVSREGLGTISISYTVIIGHPDRTKRTTLLFTKKPVVNHTNAVCCVVPSN